jgi:2,4-dienoyl-CoA reductase (NADPH2)
MDRLGRRLLILLFELKMRVQQSSTQVPLSCHLIPPLVSILGIGWHEARVPTIATSVPRGAFSWVTKRLKGSVKVPLCTTNRINTPEVGDAILRDGDADMVSMARFVLLICTLDFSSSFTHSDPSLLILISF